MSETYRECRITGCANRHPRDMLVCRLHWLKLPQSLRSSIWATYRNGEGIFDADYLQAVEDAEAFLEDRQPRDMMEVLS